MHFAWNTVFSASACYVSLSNDLLSDESACGRMGYARKATNSGRAKNQRRRTAS